MSIRAFITITLLGLILAFPYWIYIPAVVLAIILFPFYWEGILAGFLIDIFYGHSAPGWLSLYPSAFIGALIVLILLPIREYLIFDNA